jgi:hypothetical protein
MRFAAMLHFGLNETPPPQKHTALSSYRSGAPVWQAKQRGRMTKLAEARSRSLCSVPL